jgi:Kef-type K+ transport system membrane component KefB
VIDDVIGLIILTVVAGLTAGQDVTALGVARIAGIAFGFLAGTLLLGGFVVPPLFRWFSKMDLPGTPTMQAVMLAHAAGSAVIIGAFATGLLLNRTPYAYQNICKGTVPSGCSCPNARAVDESTPLEMTS